ncbi:MAG: glycoside hydrolase family 18 protein [Chloroflexi bacterium]|nr:MAG: hypothetical protein CUN54_00740 [Phototrophicales bacterium]RMF82702.1 MAG: glycoside hydrolase family 18 protein [Chloroflexota bacterium]
MWKRWLVRILCAVFLVGLTSIAMAQEVGQSYRLVGSFTSYSIYDAAYFVTDIPAERLTHLNYESINVSANGQCESSDAWADTGFRYPGDRPNEPLRGNFKQLRLLKQLYPDLQILMTVGGWDHSAHFSDAALTSQSRTRFARSCIAFMRNNNFDGINIDWRYPVAGGKNPEAARPEDSENFTLLLAELRSQINEASLRDNRNYQLTITAPAVPELMENIQIDEIHGDLDWINLTTFGFQGNWSEIASHHAPLFGNQRDPRGEPTTTAYNVDGAVNAYLDAGVPADKIVIGVPLYAQSWRGVRPNNYFGIYQEADGVPNGTRDGGILYYRDLLPLIDNENYIRFFDEETGVPWLYNADARIAISYEDAQSIQTKGNYVRRMRLGGMMLWELSFDDNEQTLVDAAYEALIPINQN